MNTLVKEIIAEAERMEDMTVLCEMAECFAEESGDEAGFFSLLQQAITGRIEYYRYPDRRVSVWESNHDEMREYYRKFLLRVKVMAMKRQRVSKKEESLETEQDNKDKRQQGNKDEGNDGERKLREVFLSERAKYYFAKAEKAGLVKVFDGGKRLKWMGKTQALLAYFCDRCSIFLRMRTDAGRYETQDPIPWKDFLLLFGLDESFTETLKQAAKKYRKGERKFPNGYKIVNALEQHN